MMLQGAMVNGRMAMKNKSTLVRFQVPVPEDLAKAIAKLATDNERASAWLAVKLLECSLEDRARFLDWMGLTFLGTAYDTIRKLSGGRSRSMSNQREIRLQLNAPKQLVDEISKLAEQWQQTPVKTAAMLLASGVHNYRVFLEGIALGKRWAKQVGSETRSAMPS